MSDFGEIHGSAREDDGERDHALHKILAIADDGRGKRKRVADQGSQHDREDRGTRKWKQEMQSPSGGSNRDRNRQAGPVPDRAPNGRSNGRRSLKLDAFHGVERGEDLRAHTAEVASG